MVGWETLRHYFTQYLLCSEFAKFDQSQGKQASLHGWEDMSLISHIRDLQQPYLIRIKNQSVLKRRRNRKHSAIRQWS